MAKAENITFFFFTFIEVFKSENVDNTKTKKIKE